MKRFNPKILIITLLTASIFLMPITVCDYGRVVAEETTYDFSDEAQAIFDAQERQEAKIEINVEPKVEKAKKNPKKVKQEQKPVQIDVQTPVFDSSDTVIYGETIYIPAGEAFNLVLQSTINSASLDNDDTIAGILSHDWIYNNKLIAPQGSVVYGKTLDTKKAGAFNTNGQISIIFNEIMLPNGEVIHLTSNTVSLKVENKRALKNALQVVGGAVLGVATGVLYALVSGGDVSRGVAVGASMGAMGGVVSAGTQTGENVEIKSGTSINVRLTKPMNVVPYKE